MKSILIVFVSCLIVGVVGYGLYTKLPRYGSSSSSLKSLDVTLEGTVNKVAETSGYSFILKTASTSVPINSMKVDLSKYSGKKVSVTGQYSGIVLYVDSVIQIQ